jgi:hypothetical protein
MTVNEDYNQIFEELHYLQNCKLSLAIFFDLFSQKFEVDQEIWRGASVEEVCQARWVGRLTSLLASDKREFSVEKIKMGELKVFNDDLNYHTELVNRGQLCAREMLAFALKYEKLDVIRNPFNLINYDSPEYNQMSTLFAAEAENHATMIQNHIQTRLSEL